MAGCPILARHCARVGFHGLIKLGVLEVHAKARIDDLSPSLPHTLPPQGSRDNRSITSSRFKSDDKFCALDLKATGHDLSHIPWRQCSDQFLGDRAIVANCILAEIRVISIDGATVIGVSDPQLLSSGS